MNSVKLYIFCIEQEKLLKNRMDTIFMISENRKISDPQTLLLNFTDKMNIKKK